ncbi:MAG: hypothetical protein ABW117_17735 [Candidatus Sedimenticola sp. 1PA]
MLGKLKGMAGNAAIKGAAEKMVPILDKQLQNASSLGVSVIQDDEKYQSAVIDPAYLSVTASAGGVTSLVPNLEEKFVKAMFQVRDEAIIIEDNNISLVDDLDTVLPQILMNAMQ